MFMSKLKLYTSIYKNVEEDVEIPTYGLKIGEIIFDDISTDVETVKGFINLINSTMNGDEASKRVIQDMIVEAIASFGL